MAGLLGKDFNDPRTMATLQMAAGLLGGGNFGQAASRGLGNYRAVMGAAGEAAALAEERDFVKSERERVKGDREAQAAERARLSALIRAAMMPVGGTGANAASGVSGPRPEAATAIGQRPPVDFQALLAQGVPLETVKALAESQNLGRSKVARTMKGMGADGRETEYQVDDYGQKIGEGMAQYRAPLTVNQGDRQTFVDPYNLKPQGSFAVNETPDGRASRAVTMRGQNLTDARGRESNAISMYKAGNAGPNGLPPKPMPASALKMQSEAIDMIGVASSTKADLGAIEKQLATGKLDFGPVKNVTNSLRNFAGVSSEESRNFATFKSSLEKLRNDSLRLNNGVQTEGDSQRAWNELFTNINDKDLVKQRLGEIKAINARAVDLRKRDVDDIRNNYNQPQYDFGTQTGVEPAIAKPAAQPLPPNPSATNLTKDAVYDTPRGPAKWDGMKFNLVK